MAKKHGNSSKSVYPEWYYTGPDPDYIYPITGEGANNAQWLIDRGTVRNKNVFNYPKGSKIGKTADGRYFAVVDGRAFPLLLSDSLAELDVLDKSRREYESLIPRNTRLTTDQSVPVLNLESWAQELYNSSPNVGLDVHNRLSTESGLRKAAQSAIRKRDTNWTAADLFGANYAAEKLGEALNYVIDRGTYNAMNNPLIRSKLTPSEYSKVANITAEGIKKGMTALSPSQWLGGLKSLAHNGLFRFPWDPENHGLDPNNPGVNLGFDIATIPYITRGGIKGYLAAKRLYSNTKPPISLANNVDLSNYATTDDLMGQSGINRLVDNFERKRIQQIFENNPEDVSGFISNMEREGFGSAQIDHYVLELYPEASQRIQPTTPESRAIRRALMALESSQENLPFSNESGNRVATPQEIRMEIARLEDADVPTEEIATQLERIYGRDVAELYYNERTGPEIYTDDVLPPLTEPIEINTDALDADIEAEMDLLQDTTSLTRDQIMLEMRRTRGDDVMNGYLSRLLQPQRLPDPPLTIDLPWPITEEASYVETPDGLRFTRLELNRISLGIGRQDFIQRARQSGISEESVRYLTNELYDRNIRPQGQPSRSTVEVSDTPSISELAERYETNPEEFINLARLYGYSDGDINGVLNSNFPNYTPPVQYVQVGNYEVPKTLTENSAIRDFVNKYGNTATSRLRNMKGEYVDFLGNVVPVERANIAARATVLPYEAYDALKSIYPNASDVLSDMGIKIKGGDSPIFTRELLIKNDRYRPSAGRGSSGMSQYSLPFSRDSSFTSTPLLLLERKYVPLRLLREVVESITRRGDMSPELELADHGLIFDTIDHNGAFSTDSYGLLVNNLFRHLELNPNAEIIRAESPQRIGNTLGDRFIEVDENGNPSTVGSTLFVRDNPNMNPNTWHSMRERYPNGDITEIVLKMPDGTERVVTRYKELTPDELVEKQKSQINKYWNRLSEETRKRIQDLGFTVSDFYPNYGEFNDLGLKVTGYIHPNFTIMHRKKGGKIKFKIV